MNSVKVIKGTKNYLMAATERGICQDQVTWQECHTEANLKKSISQCKCVPLGLIFFDTMVIILQKGIYDF